jgi:hypothetical protein
MMARVGVSSLLFCHGKIVVCRERNITIRNGQEKKSRARIKKCLKSVSLIRLVKGEIETRKLNEEFICLYFYFFLLCKNVKESLWLIILVSLSVCV